MKDIERRIGDYLAKNPGPHFASEISEELNVDLRTTIETVKQMIETGKAHRPGGLLR